MDVYVQFGLLLIVVVVFFLVFVEPWLKKRRLKSVEFSDNNQNAFFQNQEKVEPSCVMQLPETEEAIQHSIVALSVFAKQNMQFVAYDLLQAISATGMQFGEMNIFHYYSPNSEDRRILFSLASATKPGEFYLDRMGNFSCVGLTLFMDLHGVSHPEWVFNKMLEVALQLADDLDGELCAVPRRPWTTEVYKEYQERVSRNETVPRQFTKN